ncbi:MAG: hypothetical protein EA344_01290 [Alkalicoccus sp.]|nr:MAG: hypothetical protein EA344_01290 [Alkalicoccus sp.]
MKSCPSSQLWSIIQRCAYFILIVISVVITHPDFVSDILLIVPLAALYEIGIVLSKRAHAKREEKELADSA